MMSNSYFMTPEERMRKKKRDKMFLYISLIIMTAVVSTAMTFLANQL
ncbi:hypothetical protein SAMN05192533_11428 [Mesobacillus persicus]|uniref:Uncharacterized protein n=1 Tax=Mesobacillus persicus TaxID=930146 RepID=A0A1H8GZV4_9BACI|nr:hypothetical protein [Mesobacillus persicus]SEN49254.1 hypothetical protein SAMN05192533_11428 [Mesobacillus persicus]